MAAMLLAGARRLALLVAATLVVVAVPFASAGAARWLPSACGVLALGLLALSLGPLTRSGRSLSQAAASARPPPARAAYRTNASAADVGDAAERVATRQAVVAFALLSLAGALAVVAAVAR